MSTSTTTAAPPTTPASRTSWYLDFDRHHRRTTLAQRAVLGASSSVLALLNPWRGDMIATLGDTTSSPVLPTLLRLMQASDEGRRVLYDKPRINERTVSREWLASLAPNTFGHAYYRFLSANQFSPDDREPVRFVDDPELAYVLQRYREVHDLWHVLTGCRTDVMGELSQKWLEWFQTGLPMTALSAFVGPARLSLAQQHQMLTTIVPWAYACSQSCRQPLLSVYWEQHWTRDLDELRHALGTITVPDIVRAVEY